MLKNKFNIKNLSLHFDLDYVKNRMSKFETWRETKQPNTLLLLFHLQPMPNQRGGVANS